MTMDNNKEDIFKKLIQKAGTDTIHSDFTGRVMKNIQMESEQELIRLAALEAILISLKPEKPSPVFQKKIMAEIACAGRKAEQPIISRKVWYLVAATLTLVIGFCVGIQSDTDGQHTADVFGRTTNVLAAFSSRVEVLPIIYPVAVFALSILLFADYVVRDRLVRQ
jgi:hypothetical protein